MSLPAGGAPTRVADRSPVATALYAHPVMEEIEAVEEDHAGDLLALSTEMRIDLSVVV